MGNRAVIRFKGEDVGIYLHWNGGRDSVEPMLEYCKLRGFRPDDYGVARMTQVIGNWFGGDLSLGLYSVKGVSDADLDPGDNGVYIVDKWEIVGRYPRTHFEQNSYDKTDFMVDIDRAQPEKEQIGEEKIRAYMEGLKQAAGGAE